MNEPHGKGKFEVMNIKIEHIEGRWIVVVNSLSGEFREDVTDKVKSHIHSEAQRISDSSNSEELRDMCDAIDKCIDILRDIRE